MSNNQSDKATADALTALRDFGEGSRKLWLGLSKGTILLAVAVGPLLLLPSLEGIADNNRKTWTYFASFLLSVGVGLLFLMAKKFKNRGDARMWWILASSLAVLASVGFVT